MFHWNEPAHPGRPAAAAHRRRRRCPGGRRSPCSVRLGDRAVHEHVAGQAGADGQHRVHAPRPAARRPRCRRGASSPSAAARPAPRASPGPAKPAPRRRRRRGRWRCRRCRPCVRPASAMASRAASIVRSRPLRPEAPAHVGLADAGDDRAPLEVGHDALRRRLEHREPHVVVLLEGDLDRHADADVVGRAADDVRREAQVVLLGERDERDGVGLGAAVPRLVVDRERVHLAAAAHRPRARASRLPHSRAAGQRRVQVVAAGLAAQEPEPAVLAGGPEEAVLVVEGGLDPEGEASVTSRRWPRAALAMRSARVIAVTMPSSWNLPVPWLTGRGVDVGGLGPQRADRALLARDVARTGRS